MRAHPLYLLTIIGCSSSFDKDVYTPIDTDTDVDIDTDFPVDTDEGGQGDTDPPGTDNDGDGYSVEDGDCDDTDIWVNPGWPEDPTDSKDNDCDGRIDETFAGLVVLDIDTSLATTHRLRALSAFGDETGQSPIGASATPFWLAEKSTFDGWYAYDPLEMNVLELSTSGAATVVAELADVDVGLEENAFSHVAAHPDGFALVSAADRLVKVASNADPIAVVDWLCDLESEVPDCPLYLPSLAADRLTGDVYLTGYIGGLAKWNPVSGMETLIENDLEAPTHLFWASEVIPGGQLFALGQDQQTMQVGLFVYDELTASWVLHGEWPYALHSLDNFTIEDETGDFYVSLHYGWSQQVWRMLADGSYAAELFNTGNVNETRRFFDLGVLWNQK